MMNDLINLAIEAQGGLDRWRQFYTVTARLVVGGTLWETKGHDGVIEQVDVKVNLLEQKTSHIPNDQWHTVYTPDRIAIETSAGDIVEELYNPRASYQGHTWQTLWSNLQLAYFTGYATWNYLNTPFQFARPGFHFDEIEPWEESNETWRRLVITWPKDIHTHSTQQTVYVDNNGFIRRLDYRVEVAGNNICAHYLSDYKNICGITMATRRVVYPIGENNKALLDPPVIVSIDFSEIEFE